MSNILRKLASQTAIYGGSSIIARLLNYLLTPYLTRILSRSEYGVITDLYALIPFVMILLTMGMESGYFRFAGIAKTVEEKKRVFQTAWGAVGVISLLFFTLVVLFCRPLAEVLGYADMPVYIFCVGSIITTDALMALPLARLRENNQAWEYVRIRLITVATNVFFCVLFYSVFPKVLDLQSIFPKTYDAGYYLVANLLSNLLASILLFVGLRGEYPHVDRRLLWRLLSYSFPLLVSGITGIANEYIDRQFIKHLLPADIAMDMLGIYGAVVKLGVIMLLFVQMYRLAAEPFFLSAFKREDFLVSNAMVLKYFVIISVLLFLLITLFVDIFSLFIGENFREGIYILPIVLLANIVSGMVLNMSFWYKQAGRTRLAILVSGSGLICTIFLNLLWIPLWGYVGTAWARLVSEVVMAGVSYALCRRYFPIPYAWGQIGIYLLFGAILYAIGMWTKGIYAGMVEVCMNVGLIVVFIGIAWRLERKSFAKTA